MYKYNGQNHNNANAIRQNMTKEERRLWFDFWRNHNLSWRRQKLLGNYILDFYCPAIKLAIELDGNQHRSSNEAITKDRLRTAYIRSEGIRLIRFSNLDVMNNFRGVCDYIDRVVDDLTEWINPTQRCYAPACPPLMGRDLSFTRSACHSLRPWWGGTECCII